MKKALLVIDVQNDFLPGGALEVKEGNQVIPIINQLMEQPFHLVIASQDWHPVDHGSFAATHQKNIGELTTLRGIEQILWPIHCVQDTSGAKLSQELNLEKIDHVFQKGTDIEIDSYSAFFDNGQLKETGLGDFLKEQGITDLYVTGLATDYCVKFSVLDALKLGFRTHIIHDACRPVNLQPDDEEKSLKEMKSAGAHVAATQQVINEFTS